MYIKRLSSIDHVRVWDCIYIIYINSNSYSMNIRKNKLMLKRKKTMLIRFNSETTKQYRIYAFDLKKCIKIFIITFFKNVQKGEIDLKLSNFISNKLMIRNFKERLKKTLLRFSSIEYKINTIKSISIDSQKSTNYIMSLSGLAWHASPARHSASFSLRILWVSINNAMLYCRLNEIIAKFELKEF